MGRAGSLRGLLAMRGVVSFPVGGGGGTRELDPGPPSCSVVLLVALLCVGNSRASQVWVGGLEDSWAGLTCFLLCISLPV